MLGDVGGECGQLFRGQSAEEGFENYFGFAEAGIEVIVGEVQRLPREAGLNGYAIGDIAGCLVEFPVELLDGGGKDAQFMEEARAAAEEDVVEEAIPGGGALSRIAAEEFRSHGFDEREVRDVASAVGEGIAS